MIKQMMLSACLKSVPFVLFLVHQFTDERDEHLLHDGIVQAMFTLEPAATLLAVQLRHERSEMHYRVLVAEEPHNKLLLVLGYTIELFLLHLLETLHHSLVYAEFSSTILAL